MSAGPFIVRKPYLLSQPGVSLAGVKEGRYSSSAGVTSAAPGPVVIIPPPPPPPPPPPSVADYLVHWNGFADKAAALAFYAADGVTIEDASGTQYYDELKITDVHDEFPDFTVAAPAPVVGNLATNYALYVSFNTPVHEFTVTVNPARQIKSVELDFWHNCDTLFAITLTYSGGESHTTEYNGQGANSFPMSRESPVTPGGVTSASYLTQIKFIGPMCRFAWDNMLLKVA